MFYNGNDADYFRAESEQGPQEQYLYWFSAATEGWAEGHLPVASASA